MRDLEEFFQHNNWFTSLQDAFQTKEGDMQHLKTADRMQEQLNLALCSPKTMIMAPQGLVVMVQFFLCSQQMQTHPSHKIIVAVRGGRPDNGIPIFTVSRLRVKGLSLQKLCNPPLLLTVNEKARADGCRGSPRACINRCHTSTPCYIFRYSA